MAREKVKPIKKKRKLSEEHKEKLKEEKAKLKPKIKPKKVKGLNPKKKKTRKQGNLK